jgi:type IV pilus assembly protein PilB
LIENIDFEVPTDVLTCVPKEMVEKKLVLPYRIEEKRLSLMMADPLDWETIDDIAFSTGFKVRVAVATESCILRAIEKYYPSEEKTWDILKEFTNYNDAEFIQDEAKEADDKAFIKSLYKLSEAPPIVKLVTMINADAAKSRASDIHIEPRGKYVQVRYRVDGELRNALKYPGHIHDSVVSRIKILSNLDITNRRVPQDGRSAFRFDGRNYDLRVSTLPSIYGEKIVLRLLNSSVEQVTLSHLGIPESVLKQFITLINSPQGMLIITGPTGSGKTTTLYAVLRQLMSESGNIITIEDPVEYKLAGITQVGVNDAVGLSFSTALRSILRQDPDIILVGEIRDRDTADIAMRAALTGHLVLSTLHTNDTVATITRLKDIGLEPYLINSSVIGIVAQRLVRKICCNCRVETSLPDELQTGELPPISSCYKGMGCSECQHTGYKGRVGIYELLVLDANLKRLIAQRASEQELWKAARESGTITLFEDAWSKVQVGLTTIDEVLLKIPAGELKRERRQKVSEQREYVMPFTDVLLGDFGIVNAPRQ